MPEVAKKYQDKLQELKKDVEQAQQYFDGNVQRYHDFVEFVFKSSLRQHDINTLQEVGKPTLEFNILESYISSLRGEFAKNQPSLKVRGADGIPASTLTPQFSQTIDLIEAHLRTIFFDAVNDDLAYNIYTDLLAGGFSVARVFTDYVNEMSFEQNIFVERAFDPTLCGFDPLARTSHKGDGKYCFEIYPMLREDFEKEYGTHITAEMSFTRELGGFGWSYKNEKEDIVLVCDFYQKKKEKKKILKLSNGHTVTEKEYKEFMEEVEKDWQKFGIEKPPVPVGKPRDTYFETIERYRFCETKILEHKNTNFKHLPLVFFDGNSINITEGTVTHQMTRPYVYQAKGIQKLKNFAGQSLANELENTVQHKFVVAVESIPTDYMEAYKDVQKADVLVYNHFLDSNSPEVTLPPPREVVRTPIPPQISETFRISDEMTQTILGTYDRSMGAKTAPISGIAIARGALQGNTASIPYNMGYTKGLNRVAQIIIDLIPKYYRTPRTLPVLKPDGKRDYVDVNKEGSIYMNYDPNSLQVKVGIGVNFAMQKEVALQTIEHLMQASPLFNQFMNTNGLPMLLDNIDIRGIDGLKEKADEFMKQQQQIQASGSQQQQQEQQIQQQMVSMKLEEAKKQLQSPTSGQIEMIKIQEKSAIDKADISIKEREAETKFLDILSKIRFNDAERELKEAQLDAENTRSAVESAINLDKHLTEKPSHGGSND